MKALGQKQRSLIQVAAFHAAYKLLSDLPPDERFITAIVQTCDDLFEQADLELVEKWFNMKGFKL